MNLLHRTARVGRDIWRNVRSGDLTALMLAIVLAVGALSGVNLFVDRLSQAFMRDAKQLLGGDLVVVSDQPTPPALLALAHQYGLKTTSIVTLATMASHQNSSKLIALKAVEANYPLRGHLKIDDDQRTSLIPNQGEVWVERTLLTALDLRIGDALDLGRGRLIVTHTLAAEPDRGLGFLTFAPRVLMNASDLAQTQLIQPASRVTYRLALVGSASDRFAQQVSARLQNEAQAYRGVRLESLDSGGQSETRQVLEVAGKFLNTVAVLCALLCAVALAMAVRRFSAKRVDECALRRVLGQTQAQIVQHYVTQLVLIGLCASALGCALGFGVQAVFVYAIQGLMPQADLPVASAWPLLFALGMGLTLLLGVGLPPILQLAQTPALRILRRDWGAIKFSTAASALLGLLGFFVLLALASQEVTLGLLTTGGFSLASVGIAGLAFVLLRGLAWTRIPARWYLLRLSVQQILAHRTQTIVQLVSLSLSLMALFLLLLLRSDMLTYWLQSRPVDAPNRMVINILPEQAQSFQARLREATAVKAQVLMGQRNADQAPEGRAQTPQDKAGSRYDWYPIFRARLVAINDQSVSAAQYPDDRAKRLVEREFNLSHTAQMPAHNQLVAGQWTSEADHEVSVEEGLAKSLRLQVGDRLQFDVAGHMSQVRITSLRKVQWQSMRANFFVLYPKAAMPEMPVTYLAAFTSDSYAFDHELVRDYPNITLVDLTQSLTEIARVLNQVSLAVESLFGLTFVAGLFVFVLTLTQSVSHLQRDFAIMRALGASRTQLRGVQALQLAGVGVLSGFLACMVAIALSWGLAKWVFNFEWTLSIVWPAVGLLVGGVLTLSVGWWTQRAILNQPVMQSLRMTP